MNEHKLQTRIVAQSVIIGEAIGILRGLSCHEDVSAELKGRIEQLANDLDAKCQKAKEILTP